MTPRASKRAALAYYGATGLWPHQAAGLRHTALRRSGRLVSVYDGEAAGMDTGGGRWQTVCEPHASVCSHDTLELAMAHAVDPEVWCESCQSWTGNVAEGCTPPTPAL